VLDGAVQKMRTLPPGSSVEVIVGAKTGAENVTVSRKEDDHTLVRDTPPALAVACARPRTTREAVEAYGMVQRNFALPPSVPLSIGVAACHVTPKSKLNCPV
jgi:hypothetical protein